MATKNSNTPFDIYKIIGWLAMILTPMAPALFFGWKAYTAALEMTGRTGLSIAAGGATAVGLELVGILAGHTAIEYHRRRDGRWWLAAAVMAAYVIIGTAELWSSSIGRVTFLIAALVYLLVGLRHGLETAVAEERSQQQADAAFERRLILERERYRHEEKMARIEAAQSQKKARQDARQDSGKLPGILPSDWRQLTDTQRRELAHLPRVERESVMPPIADRTRRVWHERLDEIAAQNGHGGGK